MRNLLIRCFRCYLEKILHEGVNAQIKKAETDDERRGRERGASLIIVFVSLKTKGSINEEEVYVEERIFSSRKYRSCLGDRSYH